MPEKFLRLSMLFQWICRFALVALPVTLLAVGIYAVQDPSAIADQIPGITLSGTPTPAMLGLAFMLMALPTAATIFVLWQLEALFGLYRRGETLTRAPARRIRRIGLGVVTLALVSVLVRPVAGLVLTMANPPGARQLSVTLSSADIGLILAGGLMVMIGRIMGEAARIAEENRGFV
ncbi:MAG TPA: DUF2975 domain-containing protein [Aliiroseovarius sp.]|nr:DUF2975 domain-containing protein [Aliiroseovarius sp.]